MERRKKLSILGIGGIGLLALFLMLGTIPVTADIIDDGAGNFTVDGVDNTDPITAEDGSYVTVEAEAVLDTTETLGENAITTTGGGYAISVGLDAGVDGDLSGIQVLDDGNTVTNYGEIAGSGFGGVVFGDLIDDEEQIKSNANTLTNYGDIFGDEVGVGAIGDGNTVTNYGEIIGGDIGIGVIGDGNIINNQEEALVYGDEFGVYVEGDNNLITNYGDITSIGEVELRAPEPEEASGGIAVMGGGNTVTNYGDIIGNDIGIGVLGDGNTINNQEEALVSGDEYGVLFGDPDDEDIKINANTLTNNGAIAGFFVGVAANGDDNTITNQSEGEISGGFFGAYAFGDSNTITNQSEGEISGGFVGAYAFGDSNTITNQSEGEISGGLVGVAAEGDNNTITNYGDINNDAILGPFLPLAIDEGPEEAYGIAVWGDNNTVTNFGDIIGITGGILVGEYFGGEKGVVTTISDNTIENSGTISGEDFGVYVAGEYNTITNTSQGEISGGWIGVGAEGDRNIITNEGDISGSEVGADVLGDRNTLVNRGSIEGGATGVGIEGNTNTLTNYGTITGIDDEGLYLVGDNNTITNQEEGVIEGGATGVGIGGNTNTLANSGTITGIYDEGLYLVGDNNTITNQEEGVIEGGEAGIKLAESTGNTITNYGDITGDDFGIIGAEPEKKVNALAADGGLVNGNTIDNHGTISGDLFSVALYDGDNILRNHEGGLLLGAVFMGEGENQLYNAGTITIGSTDSAAIHFCGAGLDFFNNSGTIEIGYLGSSVEDYYDAEAEDYAGQAEKGIVMGSGADRLVNTGTIRIGYLGPALDVGALDAPAPLGGGGGSDYSGIVGGPGDDVLENDGTIEIVWTEGHGIIMSADNDTIINRGNIIIGKTESGSIAMCNGNDTLDNSGTITIGESDAAGISLGSGRDILTNSGIITMGTIGSSGISMGGDNDTFTNSGVITMGTTGSSGISMGCGDDTFTNEGTIAIGESLGNAGIALGSGNDIFTNSGTILLGDGPATSIKAGRGNDTLTNTGLIDGSIIMGRGDDTVIFRNGSVVTGWVDGKCDDYPTDGSDTILLDGTGSNEGDILRFETLEKIGHGTWTVGGVMTVEDTVNVEAGTLWLNDDIGPHNGGLPEINVAPGATLGASGIAMTGNVSSRGTLNLGGSLQESTISGDFFSGSNAVLALALSDTGECDSLTVGGTADIKGGTILVTPVGVLQKNNSYTVLTAGTLDGIFDEARADSLVLSFTMDDTTVPDSLILDTHRRSYADALTKSDLTGNQSAISDHLMQLIAESPEGDLADLINFLDSLTSVKDLSEALNQMSPEPYTMGSRLSGAGTGMGMGSAAQRLSDLRADASSRMTEAGPALAMVPSSEITETSGWSPWAKVFYSTADQSAEPGFMGYSFDTMGVNIGIDKAATDNLTLGMSLGFSRTEAETDNRLAEIDVDTIYASGYGTWDQKSYYMEGALVLATNAYEARRHLTLAGATASADYDGFSSLVYVGGGYKSNVGSWNLIPTASLQYGYHAQEGFVETGAGAWNLTVDRSTANSLMSKLGFRLNRFFQISDGIGLTPELGLQWGHEFADLDQETTAWLAGTRVSTFKVSGTETDRDAGLAQLGLTAHINNNLSLSATYAGEIRESFDAHTVQAGARYAF